MSYCWFEYQKAYESIIDGNPDSEDRFSFVIAEEESAFVEADRVQEPYARGMRTSCEKITPFLPKVDRYGRTKLSHPRDTFQKIVLPQVRSAWKNVLDRIPLDAMG